MGIYIFILVLNFLNTENIVIELCLCPFLLILTSVSVLDQFQLVDFSHDIDNAFLPVCVLGNLLNARHCDYLHFWMLDVLYPYKYF